MPVEILMPALSPTMTAGNIVKWLKQEGESVAAGDALAEIETDKATLELEADEDGILGPIIIPAGSDGVAVREPIAWLLLEGEDRSAIDKIRTSAGRAEVENRMAVKTESVKTDAGSSRPVDSEVADSVVADAPSRISATPLARRLAGQAGLNLTKITGSGPRGRIRKADIELALATQTASQRRGDLMPEPAVPERTAAHETPGRARDRLATSIPASGSGDKFDARESDARVLADALGMSYQLIPNSAVRKVIAQRLSQSKQTIPHFYLTVDCQLDELLKTRRQLNEQASEFKLSVNDFMIRAVALALKRHPKVNVAWSDEAILQYHHADIAVAVATPDGLITPIVKCAETKGLREISQEIKDLAIRARAGRLKPTEFQGGTFTISNLGMYGVREFAAIINPPQACLLAVGSGEQRAVVENGQLAIATVMSCTLSVDHRAVDGALGAEFLAVFKQLIESPVTMLL